MRTIYERTCLDCDWGILELYGYSDETIESEYFTCLKKNREAETDMYPMERWQKFMKYAQECDLFRKGECITVGVGEPYEEVKKELPKDLQEYFQMYMDA